MHPHEFEEVALVLVARGFSPLPLIRPTMQAEARGA
jgi:hypothetical protein